MGDKWVFKRLPIETSAQRVKRINSLLPDGEFYKEEFMTKEQVKSYYGVDIAKNGDYGCEVWAHRDENGVIVMDDLNYFVTDKHRQLPDSKGMED